MKSFFTQMHRCIDKQYSLTILLTALAYNLFTVQTISAQIVRYVKPGGNGTGTGSWNNASGDLQNMINSAGPGNEVWVMKGEYQPAAGTSFSMMPGVKIYGSFAGTETTRAERAIGNAGEDSTRLIGNGASVIVNNSNGLDATSILDGFFITRGRAVNGAGMNNQNVSPTISHCIFYGNQSSGGTTSSGGGGMYNFRASPTVSYCIFSNNSALGSTQAYGGGMYAEQSSPIISYCKFSGNVCQGNVVSYGGGLFVFNAPSPVVLVNCSFLSNKCPVGAGLINSVSSMTLINCSLVGNLAGRGGGIYNDSGTPSLLVTNCIIWGNSDGIYRADQSMLTLRNSIVQGGFTGTGNLNINPLFITQPDYHLAPIVNGDLQLQSSSPAIDMGNIADVPGNINTDLAGNPRLYNSIVDMGAYEYQGNAIPASLAGANKTATMVLSENGSGSFLTDANGLIATVAGDGTASSVAGSVTAKVWIEPGVPEFGGQHYVTRHYEITPPNSQSTGTVTLYFSQQDFTDFNNAAGTEPKLPVNSTDIEGYKANLRITKYSLASSDGTGLMDTYHNGVTTIDPDDANIVWQGNYWAISFPVNGFSGFFIQTSLNALAVKWIQTNARINDLGNAVISWKVQEQNVAGYEIQKSGDGNTFKPVGTVNAKGDGENSYSFTEAAHFTGAAFYRIRQTDKDGRTSFSSIVRLQNGTVDKTVISVYPNPVNKTTLISISSAGTQKIEYQLISASGTILDQHTVQVAAGNSSIPFNTSMYPAGFYYLKIKAGTMNTQIKIVKL